MRYVIKFSSFEDVGYVIDDEELSTTRDVNKGGRFHIQQVLMIIENHLRLIDHETTWEIIPETKL